jgi:Ribosome-associated heat shock protein implicated in the recycling of the 50S subunit (S4 paralog)
MTSDILGKKTLRLDLYLYYIRIFKSRSLATKFISSNRLRISGKVTQKPHKLISAGDVLTMNKVMIILK